SVASSSRCFAPSIDTRLSPRWTSSGPRILNSVGEFPISASISEALPQPYRHLGEAAEGVGMGWITRRPSLVSVTAALAVIAAIALAAPVFGLSKSIKKAIQKEVAKQVAGATGAQGPAGSNGADAEPLAYAHVGSQGVVASKNLHETGASLGFDCLK